MKKIICTILVLATAMITLVSCGGADDFVPAGYKKATDGKNTDYILYVPEGWTVDMSTGVTTAYASDRSNISFIGFELDDTIINFTPVTSEGESTSGTEAATEGEKEENKITTAEEYWAYYEETFKDTFTDMEYVENGVNTVMTAKNLEAKKYVYKATVTGGKYVFMQVVLVKDLTVYIFTYTATEENYESHIEEVTEMLGYLEVK